MTENHYDCLIVDDEADLAAMTAEYFQMFEVKTAAVNSAEECRSFLAENEVELVLLDINLGDGSGFEVCREIREKQEIPILFISARQSDDDVLVALSIGGDDYVKKPYSLSVLLAKVKVILKRIRRYRAVSKNTENTASAVESPAEKELLRLEPETMSALVRGERIPLKAREFALLSCLYDHRNTIVTKDTLFREVWGDAFYGDGTLNVHIRKLREKLEEDPNDPKLIQTVWGTGYRLEMPE